MLKTELCQTTRPGCSSVCTFPASSVPLPCLSLRQRKSCVPFRGLPGGLCAENRKHCVPGATCFRVAGAVDAGCRCASSQCTAALALGSQTVYELVSLAAAAVVSVQCRLGPVDVVNCRFGQRRAALLLEHLYCVCETHVTDTLNQKYVGMCPKDECCRHSVCY